MAGQSQPHMKLNLMLLNFTQGRAKLIFVGGGINHKEKAQSPEGKDVQGMTVLYFQTPQTWSGFSNLELCVPGLHPNLLSVASEKFQQD